MRKQTGIYQGGVYGSLRLTLLLLVLPLLLHADASRQDWLGEFAMNHDGHLGTLRIMASKRKCPTSSCPGLDVQYIDDHGTAYSGSVNALDDSGQHMSFTIGFPGNSQVFNVYIFSFDKTKLAGTTVLGGRTFGVLATKSGGPSPMLLGEAAKYPTKNMNPKAQVVGKGAGVIAPPYSGTPAGTPTRVLSTDGSLELHYPDGTVMSKHLRGCGWNVRYPDGRFVPAECLYAQVIPVIPPPPPSGSKEEVWLKGQDDELLSILQELLGGANSKNFQNYIQNYENPAEPVVYKRVYLRTQAISQLIPQ